MQPYDFNQDWYFWKQEEEWNRTLISLPHNVMIYKKRIADRGSGSAGAFFTAGLPVLQDF